MSRGCTPWRAARPAGPPRPRPPSTTTRRRGRASLNSSGLHWAPLHSLAAWPQARASAQPSQLAAPP
eukprot:1928806-Lingulodinium_polyedra.AAC.1